MECWGPKWEILLRSTGESKIWDAERISDDLGLLGFTMGGAAYGVAMKHLAMPSSQGTNVGE